MPFLKFFILIINFLLVNPLSSEEKNPTPIFYLIDQKENIFLIRGKYPIENKKVLFDQLKWQIKDYLSQQGIELVDDFELFSISLLNTFAESQKCKLESKWFYQNHQTLWRYPLFGSLCNPCCLSKCLRKMMYATDPDGLQHLTSTIKWLIDQPYPKNSQLVIYLHCNAGKDRTGEATACYLMQYHGYSYKEVMNLNEKIAKRTLRLLSKNAIRWYAFYLRETKNYQTIGKID